MTELEQKVYHYLRLIPKGYVSTYQDIAIYLGNKNCSRVVGNILHKNKEPDLYPCYKIVNRNGKLSTHYSYGGLDGQKMRLEKDGIEVINNKVDLKRYRLREVTNNE